MSKTIVINKTPETEIDVSKVEITDGIIAYDKRNNKLFGFVLWTSSGYKIVAPVSYNYSSLFYKTIKEIIEQNSTLLFKTLN